MRSHEFKNKNRLLVYRQRMGYTQEQVAHLLGQRRTAMLSSYENGRTLPPLAIALRLGIVLRVPVEFLFAGLYDGLRHEIRSEEQRLSSREGAPS